MNKRKAAKPVAPELPVLYIAERHGHPQMNRADRITLKRVRIVAVEDGDFRFNKPFAIDNGISWWHSINDVARLVKDGGRAYGNYAIATEPEEALAMLAGPVGRFALEWQARSDGCRETLKAINARIEKIIKAARTKQKK